MKVKVAKWGNSLGVRLPKAAAEAVGAVDGIDLELTVEGRSLKLVPQLRRSGDLLKEMLDEIDRLGLKPSETVEWGPDVGSEIIDDEYSRGEITLDDILKPKSTSEKRAEQSMSRTNAPRRR